MRVRVSSSSGNVSWREVASMVIREVASMVIREVASMVIRVSSYVESGVGVGLQ